jgi:hypothetical protein
MESHEKLNKGSRAEIWTPDVPTVGQHGTHSSGIFRTDMWKYVSSARKL